jgi:hypothetical protein
MINKISEEPICLERGIKIEEYKYQIIDIENKTNIITPETLCIAIANIKLRWDDVIESLKNSSFGLTIEKKSASTDCTSDE